MRLAMELPRHNWLVKHLIKENKLKAEDAKPLNTSPEEEEKPGEENNTQSQVKVQGSTNLESEINNPEQSSDPKFKQQKVESAKVNKEVGEEGPVETEFQSSKAIDPSTPEGEIFKAHNNIKGSYMVGIVKPFQHLKMFPVNMSNDGFAEKYNDEVMSPPALCIVDEDAASSSQDEGRREENSKPNENWDSNNTKLEIVSDLGASTSVAPMTFDPKNNLSLDAGTDKSPFKKPNPFKSKIDEETSKTHSERPTNEMQEEDSSIKITKCCSLLLDLSKKETEHDPEQPLDLSVPVKKEKSPDILDLTTNSKPEANHQKPLKPQPANDTPTPSQVSKSEEKDWDVIVIEDNEDSSQKQTKINPTSTEQNQLGGKEAQFMKDCFVKLINAPELKQNSDVENIQRRNSEDIQAREKFKRQMSVPVFQNDNRMVVNTARRQQSLSYEHGREPQRTPDEDLQAMLKRPYARISYSTPVTPPIHGIGSSPDPKRRKLENGPNSFQKQFIQSPPNLRSDMIRPLKEPQGPHKDFNNIVQRGQDFFKLAAPLAFSHNISEQASTQQIIQKNIVFSPKQAEIVAKYPKLPSHLPPVPPSRKIVSQERQTPLISTFSMQQVRPHTSTGILQRQAPTTINISAVNNLQRSVPTYTRMPLDVNNNNITSLIHNRTTAAPNLTSSGAPVSIYPFPNMIRQVTRAPSSGINRAQPQYRMINARPNNPQHIDRVPNNPVPPNIPQMGPNRPAKEFDFHNATPQFIQQQQRAVDEKIQQLEALKRELSMREKTIKLQPNYQQLRGSQNVVNRPQNIHRMAPPAYPQIPTNHHQVRIPTRPAQPTRLPPPPVHQHVQPIAGYNVKNTPSPNITLTQGGPVYRNGGLSINKKETLKTNLNEPIVIDDDASQSLMARNRHTYSFHPPLSKNRDAIPSNMHKSLISQNRPRLPNVQPIVPKPRQQGIQIKQNPNPGSGVEVCCMCGNKSFFLCSGCKKTWYCSKDCQFKDWGKHSKQCTG